MDFYLLKGGSGSHVIDEVSFRVYKKKKVTNLNKTNKEKTYALCGICWAGSFSQALVSLESYMVTLVQATQATIQPGSKVPTCYVWVALDKMCFTSTSGSHEP